MKIITKENPIVLENTGKDGESFDLNIYSNNTPTNVGFQLVFPEDCEVVNFTKNSIIIWRKRPEK